MTKAYDLLAMALQQRIPIIGHCLGGQMFALAIGGKVVNASIHKSKNLKRIATN
jgi:anthranilate/para-aminobenzoate synthase component II